MSFAIFFSVCQRWLESQNCVLKSAKSVVHLLHWRLSHWFICFSVFLFVVFFSFMSFHNIFLTLEFLVSGLWLPQIWWSFLQPCEDIPPVTVKALFSLSDVGCATKVFYIVVQLYFQACRPEEALCCTWCCVRSTSDAKWRLQIEEAKNSINLSSEMR